MEEKLQTRTLRDFVRDARRLNAEEFRATHGRVYLLCQSPELIRVRPDDALETAVPEGLREAATAARSPAQMLLEQLVFGIRAESLAGQDDVVTIGSSDTNDVVIADKTISAHHAALRHRGLGMGFAAACRPRTESTLTARATTARCGQFEIQDAGSKNGTVVAAQPLARGQWQPLASGDQIVLGALMLTFLDSEALCALSLRASQILALEAVR